MKLLKIVLVCFISTIKLVCLFGQSQNTSVINPNCGSTPELFIIGITDELVVNYLWAFEGNPTFYILEYKGIDGCLALEFSETPLPANVGDIQFIPDFEQSCPPDVWTEVPGPNLKTGSATTPSYKNRSGQANGFFKSCIHFEFRMKVICDGNTLYSNAVPYFYDNGNCLSCQPAMSVLGNHEADATFEVENHLSSDVQVLANVTYKAGDRIELRSGFSTKPGFNFKATNQSCTKPDEE